MKINIEFMRQYHRDMARDDIITIACINPAVRYSEEDYGFDLATLNEVRLNYDSVTRVNTGVKIKTIKGILPAVVPRSSLATKGLFIPNSPGIIDVGYRGDIGVLLYMYSVSAFRSHFRDWIIPKGVRIAQLILIPALLYTNTELKIDEINIIYTESEEVYYGFEYYFPSDRSSNGFGSTGVWKWQTKILKEKVLSLKEI